MEEHDDFESQLGSVSGDDPLDALLDDLYFLKCSLVKNGKFTTDSASFFDQISNLLDAHPELCAPLLKWKFLEKELLYFLRDKKFKESIGIATKILVECKKAPDLYFTKKFLFFITEKLYCALIGKEEIEGMQEPSGGLGSIKDSLPTDFVEMNAIDKLEDLRSSQLDEYKFSSMPDLVPSVPERINYSVVKSIMIFVTELISIRRTAAVQILYDLSFFELANVCICVETAVMFNSVFKGVSFPYSKPTTSNGEHWIQDGLYEVHRNLFEPEIIFRNKDLFTPQTVLEHLAAGVYDKVYQQCTNILDFADMAFTDCFDILLYKRIPYFTQDLENLIFEGKNEKAFRLYRRSLESGAITNKMLINPLIKAIDSSELRREAAISLFYFIGELESTKLFTEVRIRKIFECLEYNCEHECIVRTEGLRIAGYAASQPREKKEVEEIPTLEHSFDSNQISSHIFGNTADKGLYEEPEVSIKQKKRSVLEAFSEFENDFEAAPECTVRSHICERRRILFLIKHLYGILPREIFFKPSYLILFAVTLTHVPEEKAFITAYFNDFVGYCTGDTKNIARVFLPAVTKSREPKTREYKIEDSCSDFYGIKETLGQNDPIVNTSPKQTKENTPTGLKLVRNMIDSDED